MQPSNKHFRKRDAVLNSLRSTKAHPSAEMLYEKLKPEIPDISLATVYRNLSLFKKQGLAMSVATVSGVERFDGNTEPHVHFVCTGCGKVVDLHRLEVPAGLTAEAESTTGCQVSSCQLTFHGMCTACQNKIGGN